MGMVEKWCIAVNAVGKFAQAAYRQGEVQTAVFLCGQAEGSEVDAINNARLARRDLLIAMNSMMRWPQAFYKAMRGFRLQTREFWRNPNGDTIFGELGTTDFVRMQICRHLFMNFMPKGIVAEIKWNYKSVNSEWRNLQCAIFEDYRNVTDIRADEVVR